MWRWRNNNKKVYSNSFTHGKRDAGPHRQMMNSEGQSTEGLSQAQQVELRLEQASQE
jgi:hypothetical protein